jgi:predicted ATPase
LVEQGRREEGIADLRSGVDAYHATGANLESPHWLALLAEACGKVGRIDDAQAALREARNLVAGTGIRYHEAELHRLEGEWLVGCDEQQSEGCFRRGMEIASAQQAKSFELRAALRLARLWQTQGRNTEARDLLAPLYGWFAEGFETRDLKEAKALLDELG